MPEPPINRYLDHAILKPEMTPAEVADAIQLGLDYDVRSVCVRPADIPIALEMCEAATTDVGCVLGFPHGCALSESKADEARRYVALGVAEVDMVANYGRIRCGEWDYVEADIRAVADITRPAGVVLKVIFETSTLDLEQIARATEAAVAAGADFVKTATGFNGEGATEEGIATMLKASAGRIGVKASGGIRDRRRAELFRAMGCTRLGVGFTSTPIICGAATSSEQGDGGSY